ncbi:MAG: hypothetical protein ACRETW_03930 [Stenotrophobium sp.]
MRTLFLLTVLALSAPVFAQDGGKAAAKTAGPASAATYPDEMPALDTAHAADKAGAGKAPGEAGTTIIGDNNESPIGLYITPWRNSSAEKDYDRPARLLQEQMLPLDPGVFTRQVQYYDALSAAAKKKSAPP